MNTARDYYKSLIKIPSSDCNFKCALNYASDDELARARDYLEANPFGNKSRLSAVKREIRKRERNKND